jgi:hypothetical protein
MDRRIPPDCFILYDSTRSIDRIKYSYTYLTADTYVEHLATVSAAVTGAEMKSNPGNAGTYLCHFTSRLRIQRMLVQRLVK